MVLLLLLLLREQRREGGRRRAGGVHRLVTLRRGRRRRGLGESAAEVVLAAALDAGATVKPWQMAVSLASKEASSGPTRCAPAWGRDGKLRRLVLGEHRVLGGVEGADCRATCVPFLGRRGRAPPWPVGSRDPHG